MACSTAQRGVMTGDAAAVERLDLEDIRRGLETDGIIVRQGAFPPSWVQQVREDIVGAFEQATCRVGAAVGRGPNRRVVCRIRPEALSGFVELGQHHRR